MKLIYEKLRIDQNQQELLEYYIMDIIRGTMSYNNDGISRCFKRLIQLRNDELAKLKSGGPIAQLWLQYIQMISIANNFIHVGTLGL